MAAELREHNFIAACAAARTKPGNRRVEKIGEDWSEDRSTWNGSRTPELVRRRAQGALQLPRERLEHDYGAVDEGWPG